MHALHSKSFDPYPFILLNLLFSTQAAYAAPLILLAQTRQADRDKASETADAKHRQEEADRQVQLLTENTDLTKQVHAQTQQITHVQAELNLIRGKLGIANPSEGTDAAQPQV